MILSPRLNKIAELIDENSRIADIGTDHGKLPVMLLSTGKIQSAIASDIRENPLQKAIDLSEEYKVTDRFEARLGGGLSTLDQNEVDQIVIAGMGGEMIESILEDDFDLAQQTQSLILQPMTKITELRKYLQTHHFKILEEYFIKEEGKRDKFYQILKVTSGKMSQLNEVDFEIGFLPTVHLDQTYLEFLEFKLSYYKKAINSMAHSDKEETKKRRLDFERRFISIQERYESIKNSQPI